MNNERQKAPKRLLIMAGGTGGHVFPALAVAEHLKQQGWEIRWLGTRDRMEAELVPKYGIDIEFIKINGLRGKGIMALLSAPCRIINAILSAKRIIQRYRPHAVLGMGGYVSGPGGIAAWLCHVPVILHEQNGIAGVTNRLLAKFASKVLQAFPSAFPNADVVGNPVRKDVLQLPLPEERAVGRQGPLRILVLGGSQGARVLNQIVPKVCAELGETIEILHQVGKGAFSQVEQDYVKASVQADYQVVEFINDIAKAYAWADIVICRSGALTVSEIAVAGLPAIFIPFMHKDRQQYWNAVPLEQVGAAVIIEQPNLTVETLVAELHSRDRQQWLAMGVKARSLAIIDSTEKVADAIIVAAKD